MYEDNEKRINWLSILKRVIVILIVLIIVFGIITLVTKCTKKAEDVIETPQQVNLKSQINDVQNATIKYLTVETLPLTLNQTKTIKLKYLNNKNLVTNLKDSNGNTCDTDLTQSEITRLENNYAMKTTVVCGKNKDYSVVYIGCFSFCKDGICVGNDTSTNGICTISNTKDNNNKTDDKNSTTKNNTTKTTKTTKKNTTKTTKKSSKTTSAKILYEYKKANTTYYCDKGELLGTECKYSETWTYMGKVNETKVPKVSTYTVNADMQSVSFTNPSYAVNTKTATYELVTYKNGKYVYNKYTCTNGTLNGKSCTISTTTNNVVKSCDDSTYTYNSKDNTCTKQVIVTLWGNAKELTTYEYTWSENKNLPGWTRTGRVK